MTSAPSRKDWLVIRRFGKIAEREIVNVLTTRNDMLARHKKEEIKNGVFYKGLGIYKKVPGLRRYRTMIRASLKAAQLNKKYNTYQYMYVREDQV